MSRLDDLALAAHEALNLCGLGAAAEELLEHCRGDNASIACARAWRALGDAQASATEPYDCRAAVYALKAIDSELGIPFMLDLDVGLAAGETWDPCVATAGVCP